MTNIIENMLSGKLSDHEIAQAITSLRERGETADDISEYVKVISRHAQPILPAGELLDICGTGGSGLSRFNVSTASAFVISALGVKVIKHGNRGSQKPNGSFDLLESLGIDIEQTPAQIEETIARSDLGFVFARRYHPSLRAVANARKMAGGRSIFNLAGPLSNPAKVTYQVIGTADLNKAEILAEACMKLGRKRAAVVCGEPGIDEISISGSTHVYECSEGNIRFYKIEPEALGIIPVPYHEIPGGNVDVNREIFVSLLEGDAPQSIIDMVSVNSGMSLYLSGKEPSIQGGYAAAKECIASGRMKSQFDKYTSVLRNQGG